MNTARHGFSSRLASYLQGGFGKTDFWMNNSVLQVTFFQDHLGTAEPPLFLHPGFGILTSFSCEFWEAQVHSGTKQENLVGGGAGCDI